MTVKDSDSLDGCGRVLYASLVNSNDLSYHEKKHVRQAFYWHQGKHTELPNLVECMTVLRVVGENFLIRLDDGLGYRYLRFDPIRNRVVLIDPVEKARVPLEETQIGEFFSECVVSFVQPNEMVKKSFSVITIVENPEHGKKIIPGEYTETLTLYEETGGEVVYEPEKTLELPESMSPEEVDEWLTNQDVTNVNELFSVQPDR